MFRAGSRFRSDGGRTSRVPHQVEVSRSGHRMAGVSGSRSCRRTRRLRSSLRLRRGDQSGIALLVDSLLFGRITWDGDARVDIGTTSSEARRAYGAGHAALALWDLARADSLFAAAVELDPGFGRAQLWLGQARLWAGEPTDRYLRIRRSGTTYFFGWSPDLRTWYETAGTTAATFGFTPTQMGLIVRNDNTGAVQRVAFDFFRYAPSATADFGWGVP